MSQHAHMGVDVSFPLTSQCPLLAQSSNLSWNLDESRTLHSSFGAGKVSHFGSVCIRTSRSGSPTPGNPHRTGVSAITAAKSSSTNCAR